MNFPFENLSPIERKIIKVLSSGILQTTHVVKEIEKRNISKQAVYRNIKSLKEKNIIVIHKKFIIIDPIWGNNMFQMASQIKNLTDTNYIEFQKILLNQKHKDKVSYHFSSLSQGNIFWAQAVRSPLFIHKDTNNIPPLFIYNHHQIFFIMSYEYEYYWLEEILEHSPFVCFSIGGEALIDYEIKKKIYNPNIRYSVTGDVIEKNKYFINVIGDYVLKAKFPFYVNKMIHEWFLKNKKITEENSKELGEIVTKNTYKLTITIEHNPEKAEKLRKKIGKHFVLE